MSQMQQLVPYLTVLFYAVTDLVLAVFVCDAFYKYVAAAVETRSIFHTRVPMTAPLVLLFLAPGMVLRQFDVPKSVAFGLNTVSVLALLAIMVLALRMIIAFFSHTSTPRDDA